jgi:hypothetical protein
VTKVEKVGETTRLLLILERDRDIRIEVERVFQESINEKVEVISGTHKSFTTSVNNYSKTLSTFKEVQSRRRRPRNTWTICSTVFNKLT